MDERMIRALLSVMNADANKPSDATWCAEIMKPLHASDGVRQRVMFHLLADAYLPERVDHLIYS